MLQILQPRIFSKISIICNNISCSVVIHFPRIAFCSRLEMLRYIGRERRQLGDKDEQIDRPSNQQQKTNGRNKIYNRTKSV